MAHIVQDKFDTATPQTARVAAGRIAAPRNIVFAALIATPVVALLGPVRDLLALCSQNQEYSYILLVPVFVLGLFWVERRKIFKRVEYAVRPGGLIAVAGAALATASWMLSAPLSVDVRLFLTMLAVVAMWAGAFVLCYGTEAAHAGLFPLSLTLLLVPLPHAVIAMPLRVVQYGSAEVTGFLFTIVGAPVFREGLTYSLSRLTFVVAAECSGIHSTIGLFIASLLAGYFYAPSYWSRVILVLVVLPIVCFTNGLRMFILAMLANYVNPAWFHSNLHERGGILFFLLGLILLGLLTRQLSRRAVKAQVTAADSAAFSI